MLIIPPHRPNQPIDPRKARHDATVGMMVIALIALGIAVFVFAVGPRSNNPPPFLVGVAVLGLAVISGVASFFSWMREEQDEDESPQDNIPKEEQ